MKLNKYQKKYKKFLKLEKKLNEIIRREMPKARNNGEYQKLHSELYKSGKYEDCFTHLDTSYPRHKDRAKTRDKIRKFINGDSDDIINEKIPKEYEY